MSTFTFATGQNRDHFKLSLAVNKKGQEAQPNTYSNAHARRYSQATGNENSSALPGRNQYGIQPFSKHDGS